MRLVPGLGWVASVALSIRDHHYKFEGDNLEEFVSPSAPISCGRHVVPAAELAACANLRNEGALRFQSRTFSPASTRVPSTRAATLLLHEASAVSAETRVLRDAYVDLLGKVVVFARVKPVRGKCRSLKAWITVEIIIRVPEA